MIEKTYGDNDLVGFAFDARERVAYMFKKCEGMKLRSVHQSDNNDGTQYVHVVFEEIKGDRNDTE